MTNQLLISQARSHRVVELPRGLVLRPITEHDLPSVSESYWVTYLGSPDEMSSLDARNDVHAAWAGEYGSWLGTASLGAWSGEELLGAVLTVVDAPWSDVPRGPFIIDLFVVPGARRRGIGRALVGAALAAAGTEVGLRVDDTAVEARALYADLGFRTPR